MVKYTNTTVPSAIKSSSSQPLFNKSLQRTEIGPSGPLTPFERGATDFKMDIGAPSGMTRDQFMTALQSKGYFPNPKAKAAFEALLTNGTFEEENIAASLAYLPDLSAMAGGRKQRGGKDCDKTDYAILVAMMAVLYWTGAIPAAATAVYSTVATQVGNVTSYMPGIDTIMDKMGLCLTYFRTFIPLAFPGDELAYAVGAVGNTFVRKVGEMLIILAEAANLSLKMGFSVGAKTIWDTTIGWVKDNPTYVIAGYAGKKALAWRADAIALKAIKDAAATDAPPVALTSEQQNKYKDLLFNLVVRIRDLLCDLTDAISSTTNTVLDKGKALANIGMKKNSSPTATATTTTGTNTDGDSIEEIKADIDIMQELVDATAAWSVKANNGNSAGGKRSTRKRAGRTRNAKSRNAKTRNAKKRKSSGGKAKKVSRKIKSRKGRKTRRRGSKKR